MTQYTRQTKKFDAEVGKILDLMINSIYKNKDIFLRELISNASDACDKLRYQSISNHNLGNKSSEPLKICININKSKRTISISDNGIGMNQEDLINNLGTIARSGTQRFLRGLKNDKSNHLNLIGQFGVGFYSAYMVSDLIQVISTKAGEKSVYEWASDGKGEYSITKSNENLISGTKIILKIKKEESQFLDLYKIKHIINTYSDHIIFPIEVSSEDGKNELINKASAIWTKKPSEVSKKEYEEFFHHIAGITEKPFMVLHNRVEGNIEYTNLLFIPSSNTFNLFQPDRKTRVKLYIKRVLISEGENQLIPAYLRFLRGIVDSEDLPLNISRETLQENKTIIKIKNLLVKRVLNSLKLKAEKEPKEYSLFWKNFSEILKEGLCENLAEEKQTLLQICRFYSTSSPNCLIGLDQYVSRMIEGQEKIYFLNGNNLESLKNNPQLEGFKKRGIEVLLLSDHVDNFWVNVVGEYKKQEFESITNEKINLNKIKSLDSYQETHKSNSHTSESFLRLINFIKKILGENVKDVVISSKLINSPACISTTQGGMNPRIEQFLIEQKQLRSQSARILEINPKHKIFETINNSLDKEDSDFDLNKTLVEVVYGQACLIEGDTVQDPSGFAEKLNLLISRSI